MTLQVDIEKDFNSILDDVGREVTLVQFTTPLDSYGQIATAVTETRTTITAILVPMRLHARELSGAGWTYTNRWSFYCKVTSGFNIYDFYIEDGSSVYEVVEVISKTKIKSSAFIVHAVLKRRREP